MKSKSVEIKERFTLDTFIMFHMLIKTVFSS